MFYFHQFLMPNEMENFHPTKSPPGYSQNRLFNNETVFFFVLAWFPLRCRVRIDGSSPQISVLGVIWFDVDDAHILI